VPLAPPRPRVRFLIALAALLSACSAPGGAVRREAAALVTQTIPPNVTPVSHTVGRKGDHIEAVWVFRPGMSWAEYRTWVSAQLSPAYEPRPAPDGALAFGPRLAADIYRLVLTAKADGHIIATFRAQPF
jgi:hypothetical protein